MRSTERLIRQLVNARVSAIHEEQRAGLKAVRDEHGLDETPKPVQSAVRRLKALEKEERALKAVVEKAGYRSYSIRGKTLSRNNAGAEKQAITNRCEARIAKIEGLRTEAVIDTIGTTPEQARAALTTFRSAILKA